MPHIGSRYPIAAAASTLTLPPLPLLACCVSDSSHCATLTAKLTTLSPVLPSSKSVSTGEPVKMMGSTPSAAAAAVDGEYTDDGDPAVPVSAIAAAVYAPHSCAADSTALEVSVRPAPPADPACCCCCSSPQAAAATAFRRRRSAKSSSRCGGGTLSPAAARYGLNDRPAAHNRRKVSASQGCCCAAMLLSPAALARSTTASMCADGGGPGRLLTHHRHTHSCCSDRLRACACSCVYAEASSVPGTTCLVYTTDAADE